MTTSQDDVTFEETEAYRDCALCVIAQIAFGKAAGLEVKLLEVALETIEAHARMRGIILRVR